ncbi:sulfotransferase-like domain-containing protein [Marinigracilibium pacificum]|uniref:Sulfotransferase family protein n=1 Tax=Marinigracilibium pacificum TaxID=2729599 RepID=A0A848J379_9BACT|nr:sulfotransferase family protein [Marinigracilibium pacificum]NMM49965.1 sulfotransferase family protein [Marinigracilibium pacificum]
MKIINLISGPRNISTALMYSFAQRKDTKVIDEPLYGYYLTTTGLDHPGREEIIASMDCNPDSVIGSLLNDNGKNILFVKNMAKHLVGLNTDFMSKMINVFLIREPSHIITSFSKVVEKIPEEEIGYGYSLKLYNQLVNEGQKPIVIDSGTVLKDPETMLPKICEALEIPFDKSMLSWNPGPRPEDGCWAKYWYANVHKSNGLMQKSEQPKQVPEKYQQLYTEASKYYNELFKHAIK